MEHPDRLGKYSITEVLGEGAMGVVYKGFDPDIKRTVAIKTIRRQFGASGDGVSAAARFRNEAVAAGRLTHPGIVAVYDFGEDDERGQCSERRIDVDGITVTRRWIGSVRAGRGTPGIFAGRDECIDRCVRRFVGLRRRGQRRDEPARARR